MFTLSGEQFIDTPPEQPTPWRLRLVGLAMAACALASGCGAAPETPHDRSTPAGVEKLYQETPISNCDDEHFDWLETSTKASQAAKCDQEQRGPIALVNFSELPQIDAPAIAKVIQRDLPRITRDRNTEAVDVIAATPAAKLAAKQALGTSACLHNNAPE
jgi:hypothetical protein